MPTLEELKRENAKLRAEAEGKRELIKLGEERNRLLRENKNLMRQAKFGKEIEVGKAIGRATAKIGKTFGRGFLIIAKNIAEAEKKEQELRRKMRRMRRIKKPKRKKVRQKTRKTSKRR